MNKEIEAFAIRLQEFAGPAGRLYIPDDVKQELVDYLNDHMELEIQAVLPKLGLSKNTIYQWKSTLVRPLNSRLRNSGPKRKKYNHRVTKKTPKKTSNLRTELEAQLEKATEMLALIDRADALGLKVSL